MRLLALILCVVSVCSSQLLPAGKAGPADYYQLYSWQDLKDLSWNFRFLSALTSRGMVVKEVVEGDGVLRGLDQLRQAISAMKPGSRITWSSRLGLELGTGSMIVVHLKLPPDWLIEKVKHFSEAQHVEVSMMYCRCSP